MKKIIYSPNAPAPIGPYSQAVVANQMLFISGQTPIDPQTGKLVTGSIEDEAEQVMKNLQALLHAADLGFDNVVKTSIFLSTMDNFARVNAVYSRYINTEQAPARETVAVLGLPLGCNVEISMIAVLP